MFAKLSVWDKLRGDKNRWPHPDKRMPSKNCRYRLKKIKIARKKSAKRNNEVNQERLWYDEFQWTVHIHMKLFEAKLEVINKKLTKTCNLHEQKYELFNFCLKHLFSSLIVATSTTNSPHLRDAGTKILS
jgi:hypothetical protein